MAARRDKPMPDRDPAKRRPVELITENDFCIIRSWELDGVKPPTAGPYRFLVRNPHGLERAREITVEVAESAIAQIEKQTRGRIVRSNSFWIYCAERHLAIHVWQHDDYPAGGTLRIDELDPDDFAQAIRWETT